MWKWIHLKEQIVHLFKWDWMISIQMSLNVCSEPHPCVCRFACVCVNLYAQACLGRACCATRCIRLKATSSCKRSVKVARLAERRRRETRKRVFSSRFTEESKREGGVEMRWIGAGGRGGGGRTHRKRWAVHAAGVGINSMAMKFEECHSAPVRLKTMRRCMHDCKQIKLRDWERLHSFPTDTLGVSRSAHRIG